MSNNNMLQMSSINNILPLSSNENKAQATPLLEILNNMTLNNMTQETSDNKTQSSSDDNEQESSDEGSTCYDSPILLTLEYKKSLINEKISQEENKISSLEEKMKKLNEEKQVFLNLQKMRPQFERDISHFEKELILLNTRKNFFLSSKNKITSLIEKRAELKGVIPKLSNAKTMELDNSISSYDTQITEKTNHIQQLKDKITKSIDYYFVRDKDRDINMILKNISNIKKILLSLSNDNKEIDKLMLEEKMRSKYEEYADENRIEYDESDDFDIFRQCNKYHHLSLLNGHETYTKCNKEYRECSENVTLDVDYYDNVSGTCECGQGNWEEEDIPDNLTEFNINSTHVYGNMEW